MFCNTPNIFFYIFILLYMHKKSIGIIFSDSVFRWIYIFCDTWMWFISTFLLHFWKLFLIGLHVLWCLNKIYSYIFIFSTHWRKIIGIVSVLKYRFLVNLRVKSFSKVCNKNPRHDQCWNKWRIRIHFDNVLIHWKNTLGYLHYFISPSYEIICKSFILKI